MNQEVDKIIYKRVLIDNAVCKRRFHVVYEEGAKNEAAVQAECPHCGLVLFEAQNHPPVMLAREENLVKSPTGDAHIQYECRFAEK